MDNTETRKKSNPPFNSIVPAMPSPNHAGALLLQLMFPPSHKIIKKGRRERVKEKETIQYYYY